MRPLLRPINPRRRLWVFIVLCVALLPVAALTPKAWDWGTPPPWDGRPQTPVGYHPIESGSFGEAWVTVINQDDGGYILLISTLFHKGPMRFSQGCALFAYLPNGERLYESMSDRGEERFKGSVEPFGMSVAGATWGGEYPRYTVAINLEEASGKISLEDARPPMVPGTGAVRFEEDKGFGLTHLIPKARATGSLRFGERVVEVKGNAYQENLHGVAIPPEFSSRWDILRYFGDDYALSIMQIGLKEEYGGGALRSLILTPSAGPALITQHFELTPKGALAPSDPLPSRQGGSFDIQTLPGSPFELKGQVRVARSLETLDIMGKLPLFIRLFAGTIYGRPVHHRYEGALDLKVVEGGKSADIRGLGFGEAHLYGPYWP